jgi:hypothetical protein
VCVCEVAQKHHHKVTKHSSDNVAITDGSTTFKMKGRGGYYHVCSLGSRPTAEDKGVCVSIAAVTHNLEVGLLIQHSVSAFERTYHKMQSIIVF